MEEVHALEFYPLRGAVDEDLVAALGQATGQTVRGHIFVRAIAGEAFLPAPGTIDFHDGIGGEGPTGLSDAEFDGTAAGKSALGINPVSDAAEILIANDPLVVVALIGRKGRTIRAGPDTGGIGVDDQPYGCGGVSFGRIEGDLNGARAGVDHAIVVIQGIDIHPNGDLPEIINAFDPAPLFFGLGERGQKHSRKDGDDRDDHEQLDQSERRCTARIIENARFQFGIRCS